MSEKRTRSKRNITNNEDESKGAASPSQSKKVREEIVVDDENDEEEELKEKHSAMGIWVKMEDGPRVKVHVARDFMVAQTKASIASLFQIFNSIWIHSSNQILLSPEGVEMCDSARMSDYSIQPNDTLTLFEKEDSNVSAPAPEERMRIISSTTVSSVSSIVPSPSLSSSSSSSSFSSSSLPTSASRLINIFIRTPHGESLDFQVEPSYTIEKLKKMVQDRENIEPDHQRFIYAGKQLVGDQTLEDYDIQEDSTIHLVLALCGGKPIILFYPPNPMQVACTVSLSSEWSFSALFPKPINQKDQDRIAMWKGFVTTDGVIHANHDSSSLLPSSSSLSSSSSSSSSYLFWEADTCIPSSFSSFSKPIFTINETTAFCLERATCGQYLNALLTRLGLNTRERNDMITFWLPRMLRTPYVLVDFVPEKEYNQQAKLHIDPMPDTLIRVFMLFQCVSRPMVVGGSLARLPKMPERKGFTAVEWGAMQLFSTACNRASTQSF